MNPIYLGKREIGTNSEISTFFQVSTGFWQRCMELWEKARGVQVSKLHDHQVKCLPIIGVLDRLFGVGYNKHELWKWTTSDAQVEKGFSAGSGLALWRETRRGLFLQVPFRNYSYRCLFKLILQVLPQLTLTSAFSSYSYRRFSFPHLCATFNSHLSQDLCLIQECSDYAHWGNRASAVSPRSASNVSPWGFSPTRPGYEPFTDLEKSAGFSN